MKPNSKVLIGNLDDECVEVVKEQCHINNSQLFMLDKYKDLGNRKFDYHNCTYEIKSFAKYQIHNSCLAIQAFEIISKDLNINIDYSLIKTALINSVWQNRFEIVKDKPLVILDGAHNIHGIQALCESFDQFKGRKCIVFSALKRKEYLKMSMMLKKHTDRLIITTFDNKEVIDLNQFNDYETIIDYKQAIDEAINKYDNILICGSLYFLSDVVLNYKF